MRKAARMVRRGYDNQQEANQSSYDSITPGNHVARGDWESKHNHWNYPCLQSGDGRQLGCLVHLRNLGFSSLSY